jgi:hypothetical protein
VISWFLKLLLFRIHKLCAPLRPGGNARLFRKADGVAALKGGIDAMVGLVQVEVSLPIA